MNENILNNYEQNEEAVTNTIFTKASRITQAISVIFFFIFILSAIGFFFAPAASILGIKVGNIYQISRNTEMPTTARCAVTLIALIFLYVIAAIPMLVGILQQEPKVLFPVFTIMNLIFLIPLFIASSVMVGSIESFDGGLGLISVGVAPILVLVFSSLFLLSEIAILVLRIIPIIAAKRAK